VKGFFVLLALRLLVGEALCGEGLLRGDLVQQV
jgi:hypothetical protein